MDDDGWSPRGVPAVVNLLVSPRIQWALGIRLIVVLLGTLVESIR